MNRQIIKRFFATILAAGMLLTLIPVSAEETVSLEMTKAQKLDASYERTVNAIKAEDYETAKEYLNICFAYCNPQSNPVMYADLLVKRACIDVIEEKHDLALMNLDAAQQVQPGLQDIYLVRAQIYTTQGNFTDAVANLEKYIELTQDCTMYETVAQLHEANGDLTAAQEAYDKFIAVAGEEHREAGFQAARYRMENEKYEDAIEVFQTYTEDGAFGAGAWYNIGVCRLNLGDYAAAIEAFTACEATGTVYEGLYYNRGICRLLSAQWESAAADFSKSIEAEPFTDDARYNLAICQMQQEDYTAAADNFTQLIGDGEAAQDGAEKPAASDVAYYFRGVCNNAMGNTEKALADLTVCIDHGYELAQTYYLRAQVYAALGDTENQNKDLESSLKQAR